MRRRLAPAIAIAISALVLVVACSPGGTASPTPGPTIRPGPTVGTAMTAGELRLLLIDRLGPRWYCDPDEYPVARGDEQERAIERFPEMLAENDLYTVIATRLGIDPKGSLTDGEKLAVYHLWKVAVSIPLDPVGQARFRFDYLAQPVAGATEGTRTAGLIDDRGQITIEQQASSGEPPCPICLSRGTGIDTPNGPVRVERLRLGDAIWTLDAAGRRVAGTVIALGSTTAPRNHQVIRLVLADGRSVTASPGHPLRDGRLLGDIRLGETVDGSRVVGLDRLPYPSGETFDLLASGETGVYLAGGIPLGSTIRR